MSRWVITFGISLGVAFTPVSVYAKGGGRAVGASAAASGVMRGVIRGQLYRRELRAFRDFLQQHPNTAIALKSSPAYVRDSVFLRSDPELQSYLQAHRPFARRLDRTPDRVMAQIARLKQ